MRGDNLRRWLWDRGLDAEFGSTWAISDTPPYKVLRWTTRWLMFKRYWRWSERLMRQLLCWRHSLGYFNASCRLDLPTAEANQWYRPVFVREQHRERFPMIRHNFLCRKCKRVMYVFTPNFEALRNT